MKYILFLSVAIFIIFPSLAKSKKIKASKEEPTVEAVCKMEITVNDDPSVLFPSIRKCITEKKFESSVQDYMITMAFGVFDTKRVTDKKAHQGLNILHAELMAKISKTEKGKFLADLKKLGDDKGQMKVTCDRIKKIGFPKYRPDYMLKLSDGVGKSSADEFVKGFDAAKEWETVLKTFMTCT